VDGPVDLLDRLGLALGGGDLAEPLGLGQRLHGFGLTLRLEDLLLADALGLQDGRGLLPLGGLDLGLADAVGLEHARPACALRLHLLVHRRHDVTGGIDALDLHAHHPNTPLVGGVVQDQAQLGVERVARGERLVEREVTDDVAHVGLGQLGDRQDELSYVVQQPSGVGRLVVDHRVDRHDDVVGGDHLLGRYVDHLLTHVDQADPLDERDDQAQPRVASGLVSAQLLDHPLLIRVDDLERGGHHHEQQDGDDDQDDERCFHAGKPRPRPHRPPVRPTSRR